MRLTLNCNYFLGSSDMIGAIIGDIIGSVYEWNNIKRTDFPLFTNHSRFTDDTVLTVAIADALLHKASYTEKLKEYYRYYPDAGFGGSFSQWAASDNMEPYNSWGNGSAMRVNPVGYAFNTLEQVLEEAKRSAEVTHNHPEGIKGAQATGATIFLARTGSTKDEIFKFIEETFSYNMRESIDSIRQHYTFDVSCQGSVPQAIRAFIESDGYEDAIRKAISIGGDSDTIACIAGGISEAFYKEIPVDIKRQALNRLDKRLNNIVNQFTEHYSQ